MTITNNTKSMLQHLLRRQLNGLLWLLLLTTSVIAFASEPVTQTAVAPAYSNLPITDLNSEQLQQQRQLFQQAERALELGRLSRFRQLATQLRDYPLYPYLRYYNLRRQLGRLNQKTIDSFFDLYNGTVIADHLRRDLIKYYARHKRWQALIRVYQPQSSTRLQCQYLRAKIQTQGIEPVAADIQKLWLSGQSRPKTCDSVFKAWQQAGYQTDQLIWQRIELAMSKSRTRLAKFLARDLPASERRWVNLWLELHRHPEKARQNRLLKQSHPMLASIRLHTVKRMVRKDIAEGILLLNTLEQHARFSPTHTSSLYRYIGLTMARRHHPDASAWLSLVPTNLVDRDIQEWRIRTAIRQNQWTDVIASIEALDPHDQSSLRWQYWWAYANEQLGRDIDATSTYKYLAQRRDFYGFLAADHLQQAYAFENRPLQLDEQDLAEIMTYPQTLRAHEFFRLNKIPDARREWLNLISELDDEQKLAASKLADNWDWHDRAIVTMGKTDYRDDIVLRFPLPQSLLDKVKNWSQIHSIDSALTYAIIRRESAFMSDARSTQGALGLMQIMPRTARLMARAMKVRYRGKHSLLSSDTNIRLGTGYLGRMLERHDSQPVLATAAYNAGPHRVKNWLPDLQPMEAIRWIETIPFKETREYVRNVLAYTVIYEHIMGEQYTPLTERMPLIPARNAAIETAAASPAPDRIVPES